MKYLFLIVFLLLASCSDQHEAKSHWSSLSIDLEFPKELPHILKNQKEPDIVLGSYDTRYKNTGKSLNRSRNIRTAASRIHGHTIQPNEEFSFNDVVGVRSVANGFLSAPVLFLGELRPGVGGGVCQVSSTLYAAALLSGLEIVNRTPHSRPSNYIMMGLDATVAYPPECGDDHRANSVNGKNKDCYSSDLVIKNIYPWPIKISVEFLTENQLQFMKDPPNGDEELIDIGFLGMDNVAPEIKLESKFSWTDDFPRRMRKVHFKPSDWYRKVQDGVKGRNAVLYLIHQYKDAHKGVKKIGSNYQPIPEIWEVSKDWTGPPPWELVESN